MSYDYKADKRSSGSSHHGLSGRQIATLVITVLALWFIFANTSTVSIQFWIPSVNAPLWLVLLGTFVVGGCAGWLAKSRRGRRPR